MRRVILLASIAFAASATCWSVVPPVLSVDRIVVNGSHIAILCRGFKKNADGTDVDTGKKCIIVSGDGGSTWKQNESTALDVGNDAIDMDRLGHFWTLARGHLLPVKINSRAMEYPTLMEFDSPEAPFTARTLPAPIIGNGNLDGNWIWPSRVLCTNDGHVWLHPNVGAGIFRANVAEKKPYWDKVLFPPSEYLRDIGPGEASYRNAVVFCDAGRKRLLKFVQLITYNDTKAEAAFSLRDLSPGLGISVKEQLLAQLRSPDFPGNAFAPPFAVSNDGCAIIAGSVDPGPAGEADYPNLAVVVTHSLSKMRAFHNILTKEQVLKKGAEICGLAVFKDRVLVAAGRLGIVSYDIDTMKRIGKIFAPPETNGAYLLETGADGSLWTAGVQGIYRSVDEGKTWRLILLHHFLIPTPTPG